MSSSYFSLNAAMIIFTALFVAVGLREFIKLPPKERRQKENNSIKNTGNTSVVMSSLLAHAQSRAHRLPAAMPNYQRPYLFYSSFYPLNVANIYPPSLSSITNIPVALNFYGSVNTWSNNSSDQETIYAMVDLLSELNNRMGYLESALNFYNQQSTAVKEVDPTNYLENLSDAQRQEQALQSMPVEGNC